VLKGYRSRIGNSYLERARSVFGSWSSDEDKLRAIEYAEKGVDFISQDYVLPRRYNTLLRKNGGHSLEERNGFNRICLKYVFVPHEIKNGKTYLTASEATIGNDIIPTGRDCCFTAKDYKD